MYIGMGWLQATHHLDHGIEPRALEQLRRRHQRRRRAPPLRVGHRDGLQRDRPARGRRDPIGILNQPPRQCPADMTEAKQTDPIGSAHSGTLPSPP